jgi:colicin import membrane protein
MEIEIVKAEDFGLEPKKANELLGNLTQIVKERSVLEAQYNEVVKMDIDDHNASKRARETRLMLRDNRTKGIAVWHKTNKEVFLRAGQFIDAVKRKEESVNLRMEETLEKIEKHAEIKEQKRLDEIEASRIENLQPYSEFVPFGANLRNITDEDFIKILNGAKLQFEAKLEAERKAEEERLEVERLAELARIEREKEIEAQRLENERLKKEAEAKEKQLEAERKKAEDEKKAIEDKAKAEAAKIEVQRQEELRIEREKQAKLEAELKAKKEAEAEAERKRVAAELAEKKEAEKLAKAPIKKQLSAWVDTFEIQGAPVMNEVSTDIQSKFSAFKKWAKSEIEKL